MPEITKTFSAPDRKSWRKWLEKNHSKEDKIWLIRHKRHTGKPAVSMSDAMDEAICFGWIDTIVKSIDEDTFAQCFVKRKEAGRWSAATIARAKRLIKEKRMSPSGLNSYKQGLKNPLAYIILPKNPEMPQDLKEALEKNRAAQNKFNALAPSYRRTYISWVSRGKLPATREKRIKKTIENVLKNKRLGM
ncbi:YdeI/OmpD-associated family protein [Candidatus Woesearchaeota archaeon]|nr:YdeI/OmpD-associated family protein [Candidatus Woesearchaeota archaeon]